VQTVDLCFAKEFTTFNLPPLPYLLYFSSLCFQFETMLFMKGRIKLLQRGGKELVSVRFSGGKLKIHSFSSDLLDKFPPGLPSAAILCFLSVFVGARCTAKRTTLYTRINKDKAARRNKHSLLFDNFPEHRKY
jgi:hypothetical protein